MEDITYAQGDIDSALNILKAEEEKLLCERKDINVRLKEKKKNIKYYEDLDLKQYKAF
jgi:prefoldin subunit 5